MANNDNKWNPNNIFKSIIINKTKKIMKRSFKRAQSQAYLSFAEREIFRPQVKRKRLLSLLVLLMTAVTGAWADSLSGEGTAGSPYLIQSDDDWTEFCTNFDTYRTSEVKLTTNVTITTPLGTSGAPFTGTFDGDGQTMNANITDNSGSAAPFRYIKGGTIRNLVVTGSVSGSTHTSGLVGFTDGDTNTQNTIENCLVQANVTCSAHFGGLVGHGLNSKVVITGCAFTGNMAIPNKNQYAGGLLGWCGNAIVEITNSIFAGTRSGNGTVKFHPIGIFYGGSSNVTGCSNCYYTIAGTTSEFVRYTGKQAFTITAGENVSSLAVVKGTATTYNVSGITVYEGTPGMTYGDTYYVGNGDAVELALTTANNPDPDHYITNYRLTSGTFNVETSTLTMGNGNAVVSAEYFRPLEGAGTADSPYLIQSDDDWICFCHIFDTYGSSVIKLTSNINVTTIAGSNAVPFTGTFDGDGYTMNVNINDNSEAGTAPFRYIQGATIRNLVATGSVTSNKNHTAGLVGGVKAGASTIENCLVSVNVNCGVYCGGIVGHGLGSTLTMTGCAYTGTLATSGNYAGGLQGWGDSNTLNMTNCIFAGTKTGNATFNPIAIGVGTATGSGNCYYTVAGNNSSNYNGKQAFTITAGEGVTSLDVVKGAASTYSMSGITVYEGTPGMTYGGTYYVGNGDEVQLALTADESIASDPDLQYSSTSGIFNNATSTLTMGNANAVLSAMVLHPLSGEGTADVPYLIQSDDDWIRFCLNLDTYNASVIKLTSDINVTTIAGTSDNPFTGTFDGDGHTLNVNITDNSAQFTAPFRAIGGATISNLVVAGSVTSTQNHTAGLVGFVGSGMNTIVNCRVEATINCSGYCGGFVGSSTNSTLNMTGCAFTGTLNTSGGSVGGMRGWGNCTLNMTNCIFAGTKTGNASFNPMALDGGDVSGCGNCYYLTAGNNTACYTGKQAFTITAGENVASVTVVKGAATTYSVSGITVYDGTPGMTYGGTYYVGNGDAVELELTTANNPDPDRYITSYQSTSGNFSGTTLTMGNGNAVISATFFRPLDGAGTAESPYLIEENAGWTEFCTHFDTYKTSVIKLTSDINVTTPVGTRANPFTGIFDGDGYTMNLNINDNSAQGTAPFRSISGATIRNLVVTGSVTSTQNHTSGLVGFTENSTITIENCRVEATINCGTYCGGIVGHGVNSTLTMTGCAFTGTMNTSGNTAGGLQGWGSNTLNMTNCIFAGTKTGNATFNPIAVNGGTTTGSGNCYYTVAGNNSSNYNGKQGFTITAGEGVTSLAIDGAATTYSVSGIIVYEGSQGMKFDDTYYAGNGDAVKLALTIDNPDPDRYITSYQSTSGNFSGTTLTMGNGNAVISATFFRPLDGAGTAESPYLIEENAGWTEFCTHFDTYKTSVIKLTSDINVTTIAGTSDNPFTGTFDGDGHTLTFNCTATGEYCAPFAYINGATFNNLHVAGTITTSYRRTGGLIGQSFGTSSINNCRSSVEIISSYSGDAIRGGFAAALGGGTLNFNGCIFDGTFTGTSSQTWGGFVGWKYNYTVNVVNCLFAPQSVNVSASYSYTFSGNGGTVNNSYYFTNHGTAQGKQALTITAGEDITSLAIDGTATTYSVSGITVYEGSQGMKFDDTYYAGNGDAVKLALTIDNPDPDHNIVNYQSTSGTFDSSTSTLTMGSANAVVSVTEIFTPLSGAGTAESPYLIGSDEDWTEFCTHFYIYNAGVINLTGDINVTTVAGTYDNPFTGTFDGLGNTMNVNINDNSASGTAPFRSISGATIRNLVATGSVTSTQNHAGGLVGFVRTGASTIENCLVQTNVNCNTYCGGIVGHGQNSTLTMTGCAYTGTMATSGNVAGGLQGWADSNTLIMTNCIFAGTKTGGASFNPIAVNVGTATGSGNCYYTVAGNRNSNYNGNQARTITAGENVTALAIDGEATTYSVSGITVYEGTPGMKFDDVLHGSNGEDIKLAITSSVTDIPEGYRLYYLTTSGTFRGTTLTMGDADAVVSAEMRIIPTYPVVLADGTEDADNWTINPNPALEGQLVTATHTGKKKVKSVKFRKALVANITLNKTETTIIVSETETLSVTAVTPDYVTDKSYTWSSLEPGIATVSPEGVVTAVAAGTAHIRATANDGSGVYDECTVTVKPIDPTLANTLTHKGMQVRVEHKYVYGSVNTNVVATFTSNGNGTYTNTGFSRGGSALYSYELVVDGENLLYKVCLAEMAHYGRFGASYTFYPYDNLYTNWKAGEFDPTITPLVSVKVNGTTIDMQDGTPPPPEPTLANTLFRKDLFVTVRYNFSGEAFGTGQSTVTFKSIGDGTFTETEETGDVATYWNNEEELFWQDGKLVFKQNYGGNEKFGYTVTMLPSTNTYIEWKGPQAIGTGWGPWNPSFVGNVTVSNGTESVDIPMSKEPILAKTMTTAGMEVTVRFHYYNDNFCTFVSNGNGTYTFKSGGGFAGLPENSCAKALVVENGKLVFKQNYYSDINYWWSWSGYSVTINPNTYTYSQWVSTGNQEGIPCYTAQQFGADFTSLEVDGIQIYLTQE